MVRKPPRQDQKSSHVIASRGFDHSLHGAMDPAPDALEANMNRRLNLLLVSTAIIGVLFATNPVTAQTASGSPAPDPVSIWTIQDENASISTAGLTDRYYTNGLRLSWTSGTDATPDFIAPVARTLWGDGQMRVSFDLTQQIYTPMARALPTRMCCKPRNSSIRRVGYTNSARSPCRCAFDAHCFARSIPMKGCARPGNLLGALQAGSMPSSCLMWANFTGSARRRSAIIARNSISPASVKKSAAGAIRHRAASAHGPGDSAPTAAAAAAPPAARRQVVGWKPSATVG
jgi:Uncharacterized protein conserved in bacteria (DUF2219)